MDASRFARGCCAIFLMALCGCASGPFSLKPHKSEPAPATPTPMVVKAEPLPQPPSQPAADPQTDQQPDDAPAMSEVENWANQVVRRDDLRARIERRTPPPDGPADEVDYPPPAQLAVNETMLAPSDSSAQSRAAAPLALDTPATAATQQAAPASDGPLQAPVLQNVIVRTNTPSIATQAPATPTPSVNGPQQTLAAPATLQSMMDRIAAESADDSFREQFERRVLSALAGRDDEARQPLQLFSADQQELVAGFVELLIYLRDVPPGETSESLRAARAAVTRLEKSIRQVSGLRIPNFVICTRVEGFGNYTPMEPAQFRAGVGGEFVAYCEIADFDSQQTPEGAWKSEFSLEVDVLDRIGQQVHTFKADKVTDVCRSRRQDCFIAPLVTLPASLGPGDYVVKVTVVDEIGEKVAQRRAKIRLSS